MGTHKTSQTSQTAKAVSMVKYDRAVKAARAAAGRSDAAVWIIGDAALTVATVYGQNKLETFAGDIGRELPTVRNFRTMAKAYPTDKIARDLQPVSVYGIFTSQDDKFALITAGNDGNPWTASTARALVKARNDAKAAAKAAAGNDGDNDGKPAQTETEIERTRRHIAQLESQLSNARAKLADLMANESDDDSEDETSAPAVQLAIVPAGTVQHSTPGIPAHAPADCVPACAQYVKPAATPRKRTARKPAANAA